MAIKNFFESLGLVELDASNKQKEAVTTTQSTLTPAASTSPAATTVTATGTNNGAGVVDPKLLAHFEKVFTDANIPGPDFLEYSVKLNNMRNIIKDDAVLYPAAFAAFKSDPGAESKTVADLCSAVDHYIQAVEKDGTFQAQVDEKRNTTINALNKQKVDLNNNVISWQKQVDDLNAKIAGSNGELTSINQQLVTEESKLNISIANFNTTRQTVVDTLKAHVQKMKTYILS